MEWRLADDPAGLSTGGDLSEAGNIPICVVIGKGPGSRAPGFVCAASPCRPEPWAEGDLLAALAGGQHEALVFKGQELRSGLYSRIFGVLVL